MVTIFSCIGVSTLIVFYLFYSLDLINKKTYLSTTAIGSSSMIIHGFIISDPLLIALNTFFVVVSFIGILKK